MRWAVNVTGMGERRRAYILILIRNPERKGPTWKTYAKERGC
jgi:hypothetical protein